MLVRLAAFLFLLSPLALFASGEVVDLEVTVTFDGAGAEPCWLTLREGEEDIFKDNTSEAKSPKSGEKE